MKQLLGHLIAAAMLLLVVGATNAGATDTPGPPGPRDDGSLDYEIYGPMAIEPTSGDFETMITLTTAGSCPRGTNTTTRMYGPQLSERGENVIGNSAVTDFGSPPGPRIVAPLVINLSDVVKVQPKPVVLDGIYKFLLTCQVPVPYNDTNKAFGVFEGKLEIHDGKWKALSTMADLPKKPFPTPGPDAREYHQKLMAEPTPQLDPRTAEQKDTSGITPAGDPGGSVLASSSSNNTGIALTVTGLVLAAGLLPIACSKLRKPRPAGRKN